MADTDPPYVIAAADREQDAPAPAVAAFRELSRKRVDIEQLATFHDEWLVEIKQRRAG